LKTKKTGINNTFLLCNFDSNAPKPFILYYVDIGEKMPSGK